MFHVKSALAERTEPEPNERAVSGRQLAAATVLERAAVDGSAAEAERVRMVESGSVNDRRKGS